MEYDYQSLSSPTPVDYSTYVRSDTDVPRRLEHTYTTFNSVTRCLTCRVKYVRDKTMNDVSYEDPTLGATNAPGMPQSGDLAEIMARDFLARFQREIDEQVDLRVDQHLTAIGAAQKTSSPSSEEIGLVLGSLGLGIPLSAIAGAIGHLPGLALV